MGGRTGPQRLGGRRKAGMAPPAQQALQQAHALREAGDFAGAAALFTSLSEKAAERGKPQMAAHLGMKAARCHDRAGDTAAAVESAKAAIVHAAAMQDPQKAAKKFSKLVQHLRENGHEAEADALTHEVTSRLGVKKIPALNATDGPVVNRAMRRALPKACGSCGAPVQAAKVTFSEDGTADCTHCGSVL